MADDISGGGPPGDIVVDPDGGGIPPEVAYLYASLAALNAAPGIEAAAAAEQAAELRAELKKVLKKYAEFLKARANAIAVIEKFIP